MSTNKRRVTRNPRKRETTTIIRGVLGTTTTTKGAVNRGTRDAVEARDAVEGVNPTVGETAQKAKWRPFQRQIDSKIKKLANRDALIARCINERIVHDYGFDVDLSLSDHQNVIKIYGDFPYWYCLLKPSNSVVHDLTKTNNVPCGAKSVIGLGKSFVPTPKKTTAKIIAKDALDALQRQAYLKYFFAGMENNLPKTKLFVKSPFNPPAPSFEITPRLNNFHSQVRQIFRGHNGRDNLLPHQRRILDKIKVNNDIIIAQADKGLGSCAVDLERYIKDGLKHILDKDTYKIISPKQGQADADNLRLEILNWTVKYEDVVPALHMKYIRQNERI